MIFGEGLLDGMIFFDQLQFIHNGDDLCKNVWTYFLKVLDILDSNLRPVEV